MKLESNYRVFLKFPSKTLIPPQDGVTPELKCFDWITKNAFNCVVNQRTDGYITGIAIENYCAIANCDNTVT